MIIKKIFFLIIFLLSLSVYPSNSIVAVIDEDIITLNQLNKLTKGAEKNQKMALLNLLIDEKIIQGVIAKLKIIHKETEINRELNFIAKNNDVTLSDLSNSKEFPIILKRVEYELSKSILKKLVISEEKDTSNNKDLNLTDNQTFRNWIKKQREKIFIKIYEEKLN